jgi:hypothetical protein
VFAVTTVGRIRLGEQSECSTAEGSRMHVDVHGKLPFVVLDFKKIEYIQKF